MPNYFSLTKRGDKSPTNLQDIDIAMCEHFGVPVHPKYWYCDWYNIEGLYLAIGRSWEYMRDDMREQAYVSMLKGDHEYAAKCEHHLAIIDWLEANFVTDAWYQPK